MKFKTQYHFNWHPPKNELPSINLTKYVQDLHENYKILMNEIKAKLNTWIVIPCLWTGKLKMVKRSVVPNLIYRFNAKPIKIPASYFVAIEKPTKDYMERQKTQNNQHNIDGQKLETDTTRFQNSLYNYGN